jgi:uncharacterized protein (TIGR01244 family)
MNQFKQIEEGLYLGAQPSEQDLEELKRRGVRTVVDFRLPGETPAPRESMVRARGMDYVNIPVNKASLSVDQVDMLVRTMEEKAGPFLFHCASGARAAMLLALAEARKHHWTAERTFEEAQRMGFDLQGMPEFAKFVIESTSKTSL